MAKRDRNRRSAVFIHFCIILSILACFTLFYIVIFLSLQTKATSSDDALRVIESSQDSTGHGLMQLPRDEVVRRLRARAEPITLFGETEQDSLRRLRRLEIEQPDMKEGWKNDFQAALQKVDDELLKEVIEGTHNTEGKHDVLVDTDTKTFDEIRELANTLGKNEQASQDCDIIYAFLNVCLCDYSLPFLDRITLFLCSI